MVTLTRKFTGSRSISRINGETVNTGKLKEAAELLIDIHGQHDNKTLLQRKNHLVLLDLFGRKEIAPIKSEMSKCYKEYRAICKKAEETSLNDEERRRELSLYEFEVHEIEEAALRENEDEELEETYRRDERRQKKSRMQCADLSLYMRGQFGKVQVIVLLGRYVRFGRRRNLMKRETVCALCLWMWTAF